MELVNGAALSLIVGTATTILLKFVDKRANDKKTQQDVGSELRKNLWEQYQELEKRLDAEQSESDKWRDRYYEQLAAMAPLRGKLQRYIDRYGELDKSEPPHKIA